MTRAVRFGKELVYAFVTAEGGKTRLRVSADECDRLDLFAGYQVPLRVGDGEPVRALVVAVRLEPPFAWVAIELTPPARDLRESGGKGVPKALRALEVIPAGC